MSVPTICPVCLKPMETVYALSEGCCENCWSTKVEMRGLGGCCRISANKVHLTTKEIEDDDDIDRAQSDYQRGIDQRAEENEQRRRKRQRARVARTAATVP